MKKNFVVLLLLAIMGSALACNHEANGIEMKHMISDTKMLVIKKQIGPKDKLEKVKEITDKQSVKAVIDILRKAKWENAQVSMNHPPDFTINNLYDCWINPDKKQIEVVIRGKSKYVLLPEKYSKLLYIIITDENLGA